MPDEWKTSVTVPIFKGKSDVMSCGSYREVKLLEHAMKIVEKVLQRRIRTLINLNEMQFGFMPGNETMHAIFIVRKMQQKYQKKDKKLYLCFVEMEKVAVAVAVATSYCYCYCYCYCYYYYYYYYYRESSTYDVDPFFRRGVTRISM